MTTTTRIVLAGTHPALTVDGDLDTIAALLNADTRLVRLTEHRGGDVLVNPSEIVTVTEDEANTWPLAEVW